MGSDLTTTFNLLTDGGTRAPVSPLSSVSAKRKIHRGPDCDAQKGEQSLALAPVVRSRSSYRII